MQCREKCGACCIAPSISSLQKPAGVKCQHLTETLRCAIFHHPDRPKACADFKAEPDFCGQSAAEAIQILELLEENTR